MGMTTSVGTRPVGATSQDGGPTQETSIRVSRRLFDPRGRGLRRMRPRTRLVTSMAMRSLVLITVAILLILVLLPAALGAQLASAG
jgi:hypothetical protein